MRQDVDAKGRAAVRALLGVMRRDELAPAPPLLPTALVVRESTSRPSGAPG
ncbi:substrate-binding domain-containing protein [Microbacterium sp. Se5.02b]|nr:substrate-binding domain-containing protein [Microbacterium sp. Se5.02b]